MVIKHKANFLCNCSYTFSNSGYTKLESTPSCSLDVVDCFQYAYLQVVLAVKDLSHTTGRLA